MSEMAPGCISDRFIFFLGEDSQARRHTRAAGAFGASNSIVWWTAHTMGTSQHLSNEALSWMDIIVPLFS